MKDFLVDVGIVALTLGTVSVLYYAGTAIR